MSDTRGIRVARFENWERIEVDCSAVEQNSLGRHFHRGVKTPVEVVSTIRQAYRESGGDVSKTARLAKVSRPTVRKHIKVERNILRRGRPAMKATPHVIDYIDKCLRRNPCQFDRELRSKVHNRFHILLSMGYVSQLKIHRLGYRRKRAQMIAIARKEPRIQEHRRLFRLAARQLGIARLTFVDEAHYSTRDLLRNYGYATGAKPVQNTNQIVSRKTFSLFCAITAERVVHKEWLNVTNGETSTAPRFLDFMRNLCLRLPETSIIILDNARIHRTQEVTQFFQTIPQQVVYLSPYSPDYNPIELVFGLSKLAMKDRIDLDTYVPQVVDRVFDAITRAQLSAFVKHCQRLWQMDW